ncbi:MAG: glycosyl transferase group 1 [Deltaproteobacteria bacterium]|nr:glycosyl transferase group 1 [Deltaproteobacteria bacterium]
MQPKPSLLILNLYMVYPPNSGAKVVIYNRIVELSKYFRVTFCCLHENADDAAAAEHLREIADVVVAQGACRKRTLFRHVWDYLRNPCATGFADKLAAWFASADVHRLLRAEPFDIVELHSSCWYHRSVQTGSAVRVLVLHNDEREYYTERARVAWKRDGLRAGVRATLDATLVSWQERRAVRASDALVSLFPPTERWSRLGGTKPMLHNWGGIDCAYYRTVSSRRATVPAPRRGATLVFIAALFVEAAIDAAARFADEAFPVVEQAFPGSRFLLVGDHRGNPTIQRLVTQHKTIEATGLVPDVRPYLETADVVVVPIMHGSGIRYKLMEAMAAGKAIVSTEKGAEGLGLHHGDAILLATSVREMGPLVVELLRNAAKRRELEQRARTVAWERFDRVPGHEQLAAWYLALLGRGRRRS